MKIKHLSNNVSGNISCFFSAKARKFQLHLQSVLVSIFVFFEPFFFSFSYLGLRAGFPLWDKSVLQNFGLNCLFSIWCLFHLGKIYYCIWVDKLGQWACLSGWAKYYTEWPKCHPVNSFIDYVDMIWTFYLCRVNTNGSNALGEQISRYKKNRCNKKRRRTSDECQIL